MEQNKTNYVCGFYFDHNFQQVVLIWKNKPAWQKGRLNGVGGKIEPGELPITAMRREFYEETGILHNEWVDLITLSGKDWRVYFFCTIGKVNEFEYVESKEDEEVAKIEIDRLYSDYPHIPNLDWLVPMAINKLSCPEEFEEYAALRAKADRMEQAIKGAMRIRELWQYSGEVPEEHADEAAAMASMERAFCDILDPREPEKEPVPQQVFPENEYGYVTMNETDSERLNKAQERGCCLEMALFQAGYQKGKEAVVPQQGPVWVKSNVRLPEKHVEVIVRNFNTGWVKKTASYGHNKGWDVGMDREFMWDNTEWLDESACEKNNGCKGKEGKV